MSNLLHIRKATHDDVAAITTLTNAAYEKYVPRIGVKPQPMTTDYTQMLQTAQLWVAELASENEIAGVLVLEAEPDHLLIYSIAVRPAMQKHGIGKQLMAFTEQEAHRQGYSEIRLYTNIKMFENIEIYKKLGYHETHREVMSDRVRVHMAKRV